METNRLVEQVVGFFTTVSLTRTPGRAKPPIKNLVSPAGAGSTGFFHGDPPMNRLALLVLLLATACQVSGPAVTGRSTWTERAVLEPVYVPAMCTLIGNATRSEVPTGHPLTVMWGWSAATEAQVKDYIRTRIEAVTFDGVELHGEQRGGIPYDQTAKLYRAVWMAEIGVVGSGIHRITYSLTFSEKIFDGKDYYGPGTDKEKQEDKCEIDVK
jgi:hypothetical protein